jgi:hypothetical protein
LDPVQPEQLNYLIFHCLPSARQDIFVSA